MRQEELTRSDQPVSSPAVQKALQHAMEQLDEVTVASKSRANLRGLSVEVPMLSAPVYRTGRSSSQEATSAHEQTRDLNLPRDVGLRWEARAMVNAQATQYFYELTPDRIDKAFTQAGLEILPRLSWLNSLENRVIGVEDVEGERWVGKFYRPGRWSREALQEEHDFMRELCQAELPVRPPLELDDDGGSVGEIEGILFCIFPHQLGRMPDEIVPEHVRALGRLVARLHIVGEKRDCHHRPHLGPATWGLQSLRELERECIVPDKVWKNYRPLVEDLVERLEGVFREFQFLRLHGDLHRGNILWSSLGPALVDFDDMTMGPAVQDLWMLLPGRDEDDWGLKEEFLRSYQTVRPFDMEELELLEPLRALKYVRHAAWVARRRKDPAFIRVFPEVETDSYWQRELRDLEAQLRLL